ncbi:beta strand repeat-containing protein [Leptolyngbyaceae cyanobacterium UHCC 1019]
MKLTKSSRIANTVNSDAIGQGGNIHIAAADIRVGNGSGIGAITNGNGNGGNVWVTAKSIVLDGDTLNDQVARIGTQVGSRGSGRAGDVTIETDSLTMTNGAQISANVFGNGNGGNVRVTADTIALNGSGIGSVLGLTSSGRGGDITIQTESLTMTNGAKILASTFGNGNGGNVQVTADSITLDGITPDGQAPTGIASQVAPTGIGRGGDITIESGSLTITNGAVVNSSTFGKGNAGNARVTANSIALDGYGNTFNRQTPSGIFSQVESTGSGQGGDTTIQTESLTLTNGAEISTSTLGNGDGGNMWVTANSITLDGITPNGQVRSGLFSQVVSTGNGQGGDITIKTDSLAITNGAAVDSSTFGKGNAGSVRVLANSIGLDGYGSTFNGQLRSGILNRVEITGTGSGGDITIDTGSLTVTDRAVVSASTFGNGNGGNLRVTATTIAIDDGGIVSQVTPVGSGRGGDISVETDSLNVTNGAAVSSSAFGNGSAGNLDITARNIQLDRGFITATSVSGNGANINLNVGDLLLLRRDSQISTTAGSEQFGGNGGNITINAPKGFIVGVKSENSDITANAFTGSGGRVNITAQGIYGLQFRQKLTEFSDITASSTFGVSGVVAINTLGIDPSRGLQQLPGGLADPSNRIDQKCAAGSGFRRSSFTVTGRGGLPENPLEPLQSGEGVASWVEVKAEGNGQRAEGYRAGGEAREGKNPIVEATGWVVDKDGSVFLVAKGSMTGQGSWQRLPTCLPDQ